MSPLVPLLLIGASATSQAVKLTTVEGITEYALPNGLHVLLVPEPAKPTVTVNITYLVGSRFEGYGETGMAHLLEHLMFKGSTNHSSFRDEATEHGARTNGTTNVDRTNYFETFDATDANLRWAIDLEADRMVNAFIAKKDLDTEMTVVRNEYERGENSPDTILHERVEETAYLWHNYGKPTIGARSDIENVPIEHLQAFWRRYYQPDNAVLVVSGKIDPAATLALVESAFGRIPRPTRTLDRTYTREPPQDGERSVTLRRVGDVQVVAALYHGPAAAHPDAAPLELLAEILGATPAGRLYKSLVETRKAVGVGAWFKLHAEPGVFGAVADVRQEASLDEARQALLATLDAAASAPVTAEELERARTALLKNIELAQLNPESLGLGMSEWIACGDWRLFFLNRDRLRKVSVADVQRVAAAYLKLANRTVGTFLPTPKPDRVEVPEAPSLASLLDGYKGDPPVAQGEAFDPSPANVESRVHLSSLPFGMKLALLPKKTRGGTVVAALTLRFGDTKSLMNRGKVPDLIAGMLQRGTSKHTRVQLRDELNRLRARVSINHSAGELHVSVEARRENLPAVLALVGEIMRSPTFPSDELEQLKQEWLADFERQRSDPEAIASRALGRHMSPYPSGDIRYLSTLDEAMADVKTVTHDDMVKLYAAMYGASASQLTVVGDFDPAAVTRQVTELFGAWKSPAPFERVPDEYFDVAPVSLSFQTPDKENAVFKWQLNLAMSEDDSDFPAMVLGNYLLGGAGLSARLGARIRQQEGISYGVSSWFYADALDKSGGFGAQAIYAPQNVARLSAAFDEEVARALKDGFTEKEVTSAKSGLLQQRTMQRAQDASLAWILNRYLFLNRTLTWDSEFDARVAALKPSEIRDALRRHVDPQKLCRVKAGDFDRAKPRAGL